MGETIGLENAPIERKGDNPFKLPWRFGAVSDGNETWHGWIFGCDGKPLCADTEAVKFIIETVNTHNGFSTDNDGNPTRRD